MRRGDRGESHRGEYRHGSDEGRLSLGVSFLRRKDILLSLTRSPQESCLEKKGRVHRNQMIQCLIDDIRPADYIVN